MNQRNLYKNINFLYILNRGDLDTTNTLIVMKLLTELNQQDSNILFNI